MMQGHHHDVGKNDLGISHDSRSASLEKMQPNM